ncbi:MAG: dihydroorotate dehydrogenase electron transfer subunit [Oscillospiraceae bacterium]|nr:dihydroorotate dehydrogenase electron transfer subunit [Oscillospiraceae bacterium]
MKKSIFTLRSQNEIAPRTFELVLNGDTDDLDKPGQFVNIRIQGYYLRRPISVCNVTPGRLTLIYKVVGSGTEVLSRMTVGDELELLTGLGNGYDLTAAGDCPLLIGGGAGVPPMYLLARKLAEAGKRLTVILGFNTAAEVFYEDKFKALGAKVLITTVDGSAGIKGFVTNAMEGLDYSYFYTCGPGPMLKAVYDSSATEGQFSFEERMGCGFGACVGCTCETKYGNKRICRDGPVLVKEEIKW